MTECKHDWRINPNITLTSNPPRSVLVCSECNASKPGPWGKAASLDPKDWEKFSSCNCKSGCKSWDCDKL